MTYKTKVRKQWEADPHCYICRKRLQWDEVTADHYIPKARGGSNRRKNLRVCCSGCNNDKGHKLPTFADDGPSKSQKKRAKYEAKHAEDTKGAPYSKTGPNEWLATYENGSFEFFFRHPNGDIMGAGPQPTPAKAQQALAIRRPILNW